MLHLIAMAHSCGIELTLDDFQRVSDRVPFIADLKPSGKYVMEDVHLVSRPRAGLCGGGAPGPFGPRLPAAWAHEKGGQARSGVDA